MAWNWNRAFFYMIDAIFGVVVTFPLIVLYWSGSWKIVDIYLTPGGDASFSAWLSLALGCFIGILSYFILPLGHGRVEVSFNAKHVILSKLFNYCSGWGVIFFWRGVWNYADHFIGVSLLKAGVMLAVAYTLLILLRGASNVAGPPFVVLLDNDEDFYVPYPRFRTQITESPALYGLDSVFTCIFIQGLSVLVWVGLWNVFDFIMLPDDKLFSYIISLIAGCGSAAVLFTLQYPIYLFAQHLYERGHLLQLIFECFINTLSAVVVLLLWRGGWGLMKDFVLTDHVQWDCWLTHALGMGGLMVMGASRTMGGVGCAVDGEMGEGRDVLKHIDFFWKLCGHRHRQPPLLNIQSSDDDEDDPLLPHDAGLLESSRHQGYSSVSSMDPSNI